MFGRRPPPEPSVPSQPAASDVARIAGGGLVLVIITRLQPLDFAIFLNEQPVERHEVESLLVWIDAADTGLAGGPRVQASLTRFVRSVTGERATQQQELFPCTLELIALGRRIAITAMQPGSLEGLWIDLGLNPDGSGNRLTGAKAIRIMVSPDMLDARLTWMDGTQEDLLPHPDQASRMLA